MSYTLCLLLLFFISVQGVNIFESNTRITVLGQSGKVQISDIFDTITIDFDSMYEKDPTDKIVGMEGALENKHGVNSFATQNFNIGPPESIVFQGIDMISFTFESPINTIGVLKVRVYVAKANGTIKNGNETYVVREGDVKWNIEVPSWNFLPETKFLELNLIIKTLDDRDAVQNGDDKFAVGGMELSNSKNVLLDNKLQSMPAGFPKLSIKGNKKVFTFRFPRFAASMVYDPMITVFHADDVEAKEGLSTLALILIIVGIFLVGSGVYLYYNFGSSTQTVTSFRPELL